MKKTHRSGLRQTLKNNNNNPSQSVMVLCRCFAKMAEMWEHLGYNYIFLKDTSPLHFSFFWSIFFYFSEVKRGHIRLSLHTPLNEESHSCNKSHITIVSYLYGATNQEVVCVWKNRKKMARHRKNRGRTGLNYALWVIKQNEWAVN